MKIRIETDNTLSEPEVLVRCPASDGVAEQIQAEIAMALNQMRRLEVERDRKRYYLSPDVFIFFEAVDGKTFAHTGTDMYEVKQRLYELENVLPTSFIRASKSAIIGTQSILSIRRNLTGPSLVQFRDTHKQINVSRGYYNRLRSKLKERSKNE